MKPLSEPSQGRENAYLGWTDNQLLRRPPIVPLISNLPWAWIGNKSVTISSTNFGGVAAIDMDPGAGFDFFTNDATVFESVAAPTLHGITAMISGIYVAWGAVGFSRAASITALTKRAWMILNNPATGYLAAFDVGRTTDLNINVAGATLATSPQSWNTFDMNLVDLDGTGTVPNDTTWTISAGQESGGDAIALPAIFVVRISETIGGFV